MIIEKNKKYIFLQLIVKELFLLSYLCAKITTKTNIKNEIKYYINEKKN